MVDLLEYIIYIVIRFPRMWLRAQMPGARNLVSKTLQNPGNRSYSCCWHQHPSHEDQHTICTRIPHWNRPEECEYLAQDTVCHWCEFGVEYFFYIESANISRSIQSNSLNAESYTLGSHSGWAPPAQPLFYTKRNGKLQGPMGLGRGNLPHKTHTRLAAIGTQTGQLIPTLSLNGRQPNAEAKWINFINWGCSYAN